MYYLHHYVIDWDKVETLEDMKLLLKATDVSFEPTNKHLDSIRHLVVQKENPDLKVIFQQRKNLRRKRIIITITKR